MSQPWINFPKANRTGHTDNTEKLKQVFVAEGFRSPVPLTSEKHSYHDLPARDVISFNNPFSENSSSLTVWSVQDNDKLRLCYSSSDDLDHDDLTQDCDGAVIVTEDFMTAAKELAQRVKHMPRYTTSSSNPEYYGLY